MHNLLAYIPADNTKAVQFKAPLVLHSCEKKIKHKPTCPNMKCSYCYLLYYIFPIFLVGDILNFNYGQKLSESGQTNSCVLITSNEGHMSNFISHCVLRIAAKMSTLT